MLRFVVALSFMSSIAYAKKPPDPADEVLSLVNKYRAASGLPPVVIDAKLSAGCFEHAKYMLLNKGTEAMVGLNAHKQDPSLPGASAAGAACGKAADLFPGVSDLGTAVEGFMAGLYHRRPIMSPDLEKIGVGYAANTDGTLMAAVMFVNAKTSKAGWPVAYPGPDQTNIPLDFGNEIPNPIPGGVKLGGYPITFQFPPFDKVTNVKVALTDDKGKAVPFHLSTPESPATSFGQYGVICAIPKALLVAGTKYTVKMSADWTPKYVPDPKETHVEKTWSFSTIGLVKLDAANEANVTAALGKASLVTGTVKWGGMMDTATAFLQFDVGKPKGYDMVSVIIPIAVWQKLSTTEPKSWIGKTLEVESTPRLVMGRYLNLAIVQSSQLRVIKSP